MLALKILEQLNNNSVAHSIVGAGLKAEISSRGVPQKIRKYRLTNTLPSPKQNEPNFWSFSNSHNTSVFGLLRIC